LLGKRKRRRGAAAGAGIGRSIRRTVWAKDSHRLSSEGSGRNQTPDQSKQRRIKVPMRQKLVFYG
jgi:hypothetical protein